MSKLCPNCGQVIDDNEKKCPFCENEIVEEQEEENKLEDVLEVPGIITNEEETPEVLDTSTVEEEPVTEVAEAPTVEEESVTEVVETPTVEEEPVTEVVEAPTVEEEPVTEVVETPVVEEEPVTEVVEAPTVEEEPVTEVVEAPTVEEEPVAEVVEAPVVEEEPVNEVVESPTVEEAVNKDEKKPKPLTPTLPASAMSIVNFNQEENTEKSEANETSDTTITNENVLEEVSVSDLESVEVDSSNLETVSVEVGNETLKDEEEVVEMPDMPEPVVGEINPELLGNVYDEEEKQNNEKIAEKQRRDEEKLRKEAEARSSEVMEKPDLLATNTSNDDVEGSGKTIKTKNSHKKILNLLTAIIVIIIALVAVWYFLLREEEEVSNETYMTPIVLWFNGYKEGNATTMLSSYVPCLGKSEEVMNAVNDTINNRNTYSSFYLEYQEERVEVVNGDDQANLNSYLENICRTDTPKIDEFRRVYIKEKVSNSDQNIIDETNPEFYTVRIGDKWYILAFQDK